MEEIKGITAEPGGRVVMSVQPHGYATRPPRPSETAAPKVLAIVLLGLLVVSVVLMTLADLLGLPDGVMMVGAAFGGVALAAGAVLGFALNVRTVYKNLGFLVFLVTLPAALPLTLVSATARRFFFGSGSDSDATGEVSLQHIGQGWLAHEGGETVVTLRLVNGAVLRYRAEGESGRALGAAMSRLLGPRLITH